MRLNLRILLVRECGWWVAQCLEYDLAGQGKTIDDAMYEVQRKLISHILICSENGVEPLKNLAPAPEHYHQLFRGAKNLDSDLPRFKMPEGVSVPPAWESAQHLVRLSA